MRAFMFLAIVLFAAYVVCDDEPAEATPNSEVCTKANQVFKPCGTSCPLTCENHQAGPRPCTMECVRECQCADGFVLNDEKECIKHEECPNHVDGEVHEGHAEGHEGHEGHAEGHEGHEGHSEGHEEKHEEGHEGHEEGHEEKHEDA